MNNCKYALDANIFIEAHRRYYSFDLVPAFWSYLVDIAGESVRSIDRIFNEELVDDEKAPEDRLAQWAVNEASFIFESTDEVEIVEAYKKIMMWALNQEQFKDEAKHEFADDPDAWVIAYAEVRGYVVVTHETYEPNIRRKIKIPNVCEEFDIPYINTFDMLRELGFCLSRYDQMEDRE